MSNFFNQFENTSKPSLTGLFGYPPWLQTKEKQFIKITSLKLAIFIE